MLRKPDDNTVNYFSAAIIGDPGSYKTLLASTFPHAYFIDVDGGAAHTGCYRMCDIPKTASGFSQVRNEIASLVRLVPGEDGLLEHNVDGVRFKVGTVVVDTLDELQVLASFGLSKSDSRAYYKELLRRLRDEIVYPLKNVNAHTIVVAHTKTWGVSNDQRDAGQVTQRTLALEGAIRDALPGWFHVILHVVNWNGGKRMLLTQMTRKGPWEYLAKDRYHVFGGRQFEIKMEGDKPSPHLAKMIIERTSGGVNQTQIISERDRVKGLLIAEAQSIGVLDNPPKPGQLDALKEILGDVYIALNEATSGFDDLEKEGIKLIRSKHEES